MTSVPDRLGLLAFVDLDVASGENLVASKTIAPDGSKTVMA
jgi:hypothetical protein